MVTQNPIGYGEKNAMPSPSQVTATAISTDSSTPRPGRAVSRLAVAAGATSSAKTSRLPVTWLVPAAATPSRTRNAAETSAHRDPRARGHVGVDRGEQQRPGEHGQREQADDAGEQQDEHLLVGDPGDGAEQQTVQPGQESLVEADEQEPARQRETLHRADHRGLLAVAARRPVARARRRAARR